MVFEPQSKLLRTLVLSPYRQSGWGTAAALADAALTRVQRFDGSAVLDMNPTRRSDAAMSGKGSHFATNGQVTGWDLKLSGVKVEMSPWIAGYLLTFCLGKETVVGNAAPYTHTSKFDESTRLAIPTTVYLQDTDDLVYKVPDMHVTKVTITIPDQGAITMEADFIGTGYLVPGAMANLPAVPDETYILGNDFDLSFGDVGAAVSSLGRNLTSTITIDWQSNPHKATGVGLRSPFIRKGDPKFSLTSTIAATATDDLFIRQLNDTKTAFSGLANSGALAQFGFAIPSANLKTNKMGFQDDMTIWNIETDETTSYQAGGVAPITFTVVNDVPAYAIPVPA